MKESQDIIHLYSEVKNIIPTLAVLARAMPQDKTRLVRLAQEIGMVVGMTGMVLMMLRH